jgi:hypothetical protein
LGLVVFAITLVAGAIAQCPHALDVPDSRPAVAQPFTETKSHKRIVLMDIELTDSGTVRGVSVWGGEASLQSAAIKAAARRRYAPRMRKPNVVSVEVQFPIGNCGSPEIHEIVIGVSSCIPGGRIPSLGPMQHLLESLNHLVPVQPVIVIPDAPDKKSP